MPVRIVSQSSVEPMDLPRRELRWLVTPQSLGAERISVAIMTCPARSVVRSLHSHKDIEEVLLILEEEGEVWVDGERDFFKKGDAVLFPTTPDSYVTYDEDPLGGGA